MLPMTPAAVSLFGASLGPVPAVAPPVTPLASPIESPLNPPSLTGALLPPVPAGQPSPPAPFADLLVEAVGEVQHLEHQAKTAIEGLLSGQGVDVHSAMIAAQKAGAGFELMLAVRNKALAAYQQVVGMQF